MHKINPILSKKLLYWYDNNKRILPWRVKVSKRKREYYVLISEFMLQQTQVKTVIPYFLKFVKKIPNLMTLSKSKEKIIYKLWEGLGYYRRAENLRQTARILIKKYNGRIPKKIEEIKKLPGVGDYTSNALSALIHDKPHIPIDGNVKRVFSRLFLIGTDKHHINKEIEEKKSKFYPTKRNADLAEALMEFGAVICKPQNPKCDVCNLNKYCKFFKFGKKVLPKEKKLINEIKFNIYCYLDRDKKKIALIKNNRLSFLKNFKIPDVRKVQSNNNSKIEGWNYLCNYKNNISNIKMNINLFYKFTKKKPKKFIWHPIGNTRKEFIPTFTKTILNKIEKIY